MVLKNVARLFTETGIVRASVIQKDLLGVISITDLIMKLQIASELNFDALSSKIEETVLHNRVATDLQTEIEQECEAAWDAVEETQTY